MRKYVTSTPCRARLRLLLRASDWLVHFVPNDRLLIDVASDGCRTDRRTMGSSCSAHAYTWQSFGIWQHARMAAFFLGLTTAPWMTLAMWWQSPALLAVPSFSGWRAVPGARYVLECAKSIESSGYTACSMWYCNSWGPPVPFAMELPGCSTALKAVAARIVELSEATTKFYRAQKLPKMTLFQASRAHARARVSVACYILVAQIGCKQAVGRLSCAFGKSSEVAVESSHCVGRSPYIFMQLQPCCHCTRLARCFAKRRAMRCTWCRAAILVCLPFEYRGASLVNMRDVAILQLGSRTYLECPWLSLEPIHADTWLLLHSPPEESIHRVASTGFCGPPAVSARALGWVLCLRELFDLACLVTAKVG